MRILLTNDDGIHAGGLKDIQRELGKLGTVWVVAPMDEKSTTGHSLTIHKPLRVMRLAERFFGVTGSPADCVNVGMREIMKFKPDLVVSGINRGANLGQDVYYSGTVSAAREACIRGIPAFAVSLVIDFRRPPAEKNMHYSHAAKLAAQVIKNLSGIAIPKHTLINLNVPDLPLSKIKGVRLARQGFRIYSSSILKRRDHRGKDYFWVGGQYQGYVKDPETDCYNAEKGYATLTPQKLDVTDLKFLQVLSMGWDETKGRRSSG